MVSPGFTPALAELAVKPPVGNGGGSPALLPSWPRAASANHLQRPHLHTRGRVTLTRTRAAPCLEASVSSSVTWVMGHSRPSAAGAL